jgi:hypothetical protein
LGCGGSADAMGVGLMKLGMGQSYCAVYEISTQIGK